MMEAIHDLVLLQMGWFDYMRGKWLEERWDV